MEGTWLKSIVTPWNVGIVCNRHGCIYNAREDERMRERRAREGNVQGWRWGKWENRKERQRKVEKRERERERERREKRDSLNLVFTCAWQTRNADDTGIVLSLVLSVRSRGSRILLVGRLLQHLSFACCHDEDIDLTPGYTRIAREQGGCK